jgi:enamine deaminase RidA (YjgF/YER057c/UK114 family)
VATGRFVFVAGQVGWDPVTREIPSRDFAAQTRRALENTLAVLRAGGAAPEHIVRLTWYVTDLQEYAAARKEIGADFRALFGGHYPAMSIVQVSALLEAGAKVEIEATAVVPDTPRAETVPPRSG